jgi:integrase/recombinase XerD
MSTQRTTVLREKVRADLRLRNYSLSTEAKYLWHIGHFARHFGKSPEVLGEAEIRQYLHFLREERGYGISQYKQAIAALRFLYADTLGKEWMKGRIPYPRSPKTLPVALTREEVQQFFRCTANVRDLTAFQILYGTGLRLLECLSLKITDINSKEMRIRVRHGKGDKERLALLSPQLLAVLRDYWRRFRPTDWLFPGNDPKFHLHCATLRAACHVAALKARIPKIVTPHSLRHSFARHLLEQGTDICVIQQLLGHTRLDTTLIYTRISDVMFRGVVSPLDRLSAN